jgi:hypothetical protein
VGAVLLRVVLLSVVLKDPPLGVETLGVEAVNFQEVIIPPVVLNKTFTDREVPTKLEMVPYTKLVGVIVLETIT